MEELLILLLLAILVTVYLNLIKAKQADPSTHYFTDDLRDVWSDETPSGASGEGAQRDWEEQNDTGFDLD